MKIDFRILEPIGAIVFLIGCIPTYPPQPLDFLTNWIFWIIGSLLILLSNIKCDSDNPRKAK